MADSACGPVAHCKVTNFLGQKHCTYRLKNANDQSFSSCTELSGFGRVLLVLARLREQVSILQARLASAQGEARALRRQLVASGCLPWNPAAEE